MKKAITHDDKKIEINEFGKGALVYIMLGGWTHDFQYEENLISELSNSATVITISYPGYSGSEENSKAQTAKFLSTIITSVAEQLHLTRFILVGFSMGCQIVLQYIQNHPKQKAVLISPVMHSLLADTPIYGKILLFSPMLINCIRKCSPIEKVIVNLAYARISTITERRKSHSRFHNNHVTLHGALDTLIATITSFIDPIDYAKNVHYIFGDREIMQETLNDHHIVYSTLQNTGHETFEKNYKQVARLIIEHTA